jgi:hypothetical protein
VHLGVNPRLAIAIQGVRVAVTVLRRDDNIAGVTNDAQPDEWWQRVDYGRGLVVDDHDIGRHGGRHVTHTTMRGKSLGELRGGD